MSKVCYVDGCNHEVCALGMCMTHWWRQRYGTKLQTATIRKREIHGLTKHPDYKLWHGIIERCMNQNRRDFRHYGGRGILVCERWQRSFPAFLKDMGARPTSKHEIERIDNDGHYESSNCGWALRKTQMRNTRRTRLTPDLVREVRVVRSSGQSVRAWARLHGVSAGAAQQAAIGRTWDDIT